MKTIFLILVILGLPAMSADKKNTFTPASHEGHGHSSEIDYYTCSMHPSVKSDKPGSCPICSMDLIPVAKSTGSEPGIVIDALRRQTIGVKTETVSQKPLDVTIRAVGKINYNESRLRDVNLKIEGWVEKLHASKTGQWVQKGSPLFEIYSPILYSTQSEMLSLLEQSDNTLAENSKSRLKLWGITDNQIQKMITSGKVPQRTPFLSPVSGYIVEKNIVEGAHIKSGEKIFQIADVSSLWVEANVLENELPLIKKGTPVSITLPQLPGKSHSGVISFIYPYMESKSGTGKIRIDLQNKKGSLKPGMYADVIIRLTSQSVLQVPVSAVVFTGPNRLVFVDRGQGKLVPKKVKLGKKGGGYYEVLEGLSEGDIVVTSGNFLVAAESRIQNAAEYWGGSINE